MHPKEWRAGKEKVEVSAIIKELVGKTLKITDGTTKDYQDPRTGELIEREALYWLPKSQIEIEGHDMEEAEELIGKTVTLLVPRWLAEDKGLA
jgi:hypothetical protein